MGEGFKKSSKDRYVATPHAGAGLRLILEAANIPVTYPVEKRVREIMKEESS